MFRRLIRLFCSPCKNEGVVDIIQGPHLVPCSALATASGRIAAVSFDQPPAYLRELNSKKQMYKDLNIEYLGISGRQNELIELTLSYGFKGFNLDIEQFAQQVERDGLDSARRLIDSARLRLSTFKLPVDVDTNEPDYQDQLTALKKSASLASSLGCKVCRAVAPPAGDALAYHDHFELSRRRFSEIAEVLAEFDISLGLELLAASSHREGRGYPFIHRVDTLMMLLKTINLPNVGLVLDIWNWHVAGATVEQLSLLDPGDIVALELADADSEPGDDSACESTRRLPGETGKIDAEAYLRAVAEHGFDGPVTAKPHPSQFEGLSRDAIAKQTGESIDRVWRAVGLSRKGKLVQAS